MAKRPSKKPVKTNAMARLRRALMKRTKAELTEALVELAEIDRSLRRRLEEQFDVEAPPGELVTATRQAITDATCFDPRDMNRNFDYDHVAYDAVRRNLARLVGGGQLREAMELSLELMKRGSYQVEMSDEGLMTQEIEECFEAIVQALTNCDLPSKNIVAWCKAMTKNDCIGFIYKRELAALRKRFEMPAA